MNAFLLRVLDVTVVTGFFTCAFWIYVYHRRTNGGWWDSDVGRNQMVKLAVLAGLFVMPCINLVIGGPFPGELLIYTLFTVAIVAALLWRFDIMIRVTEPDDPEPVYRPAEEHS